MNWKARVQRYLKPVLKYNAFAYEEEDEHGDNSGDPRDPATIAKHQRYASRLYVILFVGKWREIISFDDKCVSTDVLIMRFEERELCQWFIATPHYHCSLLSPFLFTIQSIFFLNQTLHSEI